MFRICFLIGLGSLLFMALEVRGSLSPDSTLCDQTQVAELTDDVLTKDTTLRVKPRITWAFNLDFRNSIVSKEIVNVWGVNSGIVFGRKRHQLTLGYYWLTYATQLRLINWQRNAAQRINLGYYTKTDLWFVSLLYWPNLINNKRWVLSTPTEIGAGQAYAIPTDLRTEQPVDRSKRDFFVPVQVGLYAQWKATRWVGISTQLGYRYSVFRSDINLNFNAPYYSVGATLFSTFWVDLWRAVRHKERISPLRPPVSRPKVI